MQPPFEKRNALTVPRTLSLVLKKFYLESGIAPAHETKDF
jgi:hypothetical protein